MGRNGGCAAVNGLCTGPSPTLVRVATLFGGLLAVTRVAVPARQQHEAPWAKEERDEKALNKPEHNKSLHPTGAQKHTHTYTQQMLCKKRVKDAVF